MKIRKVLGFAVVASSLLFLQGCWVFSGGGWFWSEIDPTKRVIVGVEGSCTQDGNDALIDLELAFHDHGWTGEGVYNQNRNGKKHMAIFARNPEPLVFEGWLCDEISGDPWNEGYEGYQGFTYCPQGVDSGPDCGDAVVYVFDSTLGGPDKGDVLQIVLLNGFYEDYGFYGVLQGGNFTVQTVID